MIDLHFHSIFSDGDYTPEELAALGHKHGLTAMALTDHDTMEGVERFLAACRANGMQAATGVEISAEFNPGTMHVLGYFADPANAALKHALVNIREGRHLRNVQIVKQLQALGCDMTLEECAAEAGGEVVGRPHIALILQKKGYVKNKDEAFEKFLAKGKPGYVPRFRLLPAECVKIIRDAGGVAVLGHPFTLQLKPEALRQTVADLAAAGLGGIEVYYSEHSDEQTRYYKELADDFGLVASGGSDYHGRITPDIKLGRGFGRLAVPDTAFEQLKLRAGR
ncbi:MAG: PHP domain-containing protein [Kiritimatiellia bacterium]